MKPLQRLSGERSDMGETLIEVLIASALMALVVVTVVGGIGTMLLGSMLHRQQANGNTSLVKALENMKSVPFTQVDCSRTDAQRQAAYVGAAALPTGWTAVVSIGYEQMNGVGVIDFAGTALTCPSGLQLQLVQATLTSPDNRVTPTMKFIKGDV
jgi:hypothetical protein